MFVLCWDLFWESFSVEFQSQEAESYVFSRVGEAQDADSYVFSHAGEAPRRPRRPQDADLYVFLRVGEARGHRIIRVFTCQRAPGRSQEGPRGPRRHQEAPSLAPGRPRRPLHTCFLVSESPKDTESYVFSRPGEAPGGSRMPFHTCFYVSERLGADRPWSKAMRVGGGDAPLLGPGKPPTRVRVLETNNLISVE